MQRPKILEYMHNPNLPDHLGQVSVKFQDLAEWVVANTEPGAEQSTALRKLLEAKDAAVRARIEGDGTKSL